MAAPTGVRECISDAALPAPHAGRERIGVGVDTLRERHGTQAVQRGRGLAAMPAKPPSSTDPLPEGE